MSFPLSLLNNPPLRRISFFREDPLRLRFPFGLIRVSRRKANRPTPVDRKLAAWVRRILHLHFPQDLAFVVQRADAKIFESLLQIAVRAVPDNDPLKRPSFFQIEFPPWVFGSFGVGGRFRLKIAVYTPIDR